MEKEIYTLKVYNTLTKQYEDVVVTKKVYEEYKRSEWRIEKNDASFNTHEILLSILLEDNNEKSEIYYQLADTEQSTENIFLNKLRRDELQRAFAELSRDEVELFEALVLDNVSEIEYGIKVGLTQQGVNWKKQQIRKKLKKFLKNPL